MSWFQGIDKSWFNGDQVDRFKLHKMGTKFVVYADSNMISGRYDTEEKAQSDLDTFVEGLMLGNRLPNYWLDKL